jgi:N-acetyl-D-muramate 6-phosphate phosphatase
MTRQHQVVLFDLDGTLIDSAPDMADAANEMRALRGLPALPYESLRAMVGSGARGMVGVAFGALPGQAAFQPLRDEFLALYERRLLHRTQVFDAVATVLDALDAAGLRWGIVTNKAMRYTSPIVAGLGLAERAAVVIAGDTTPFTKPHPAPLLEAALRSGVAPQACVYIGDDVRDVQAGRAAGMATLAASWGYLGAGEPVQAWGADQVLVEAIELLNWLELA